MKSSSCRKVQTGFIDSDDNGENSGGEDKEDDLPSNKSKTVNTSRDKAEQPGSTLNDLKDGTGEQGEQEKHKKTTLKADPTIAKSGRTAQK